MFDGKNLYVIDTCGYRKINEDITKIYKINKYYLDDAIKNILSAYLIYDLGIEQYNELVEIDDLEEQLKEIKKSIKR